MADDADAPVCAVVLTARGATSGGGGGGAAHQPLFVQPSNPQPQPHDGKDGAAGTSPADAAAAHAHAHAHPHGSSPPQRFGPWRRAYVVCALAALAALLNADQNLLAPNLSAAAEEFGMDAKQRDAYLGGYTMAAFFLAGSPSAILCGYLADKTNRVRLLCAVVALGHIPCLCTYFVTQFWQFFALRVLTGAALGGAVPLVFSLLGDLFPVGQRAAMAAAVQIALGGGVSGGQLLAGLLGPATNWRVPYLIVAAPSIAIALIVLLTIRDPPRGAYEEALQAQYAEGVAYAETITWAKAKAALRCRSNLLLMAVAVPGCLPWGVIGTFLVDYLAQEQGFSVQLATVVLTVFNIGGGAGLVGGGAAGQLLYNWRKEWMPVMCGLCVIACPWPMYYLVNANLRQAGLASALVVAALAGLLSAVASPNMRAVALNVNEPETRGVVLALQAITDDLGRGLGPIIVASFISTLGGRRGAFNAAVLAWLPSGLLMLGMAFTMRRDEAAVQARLAARAKAAAAGGSADGGLGGGRDLERNGSTGGGARKGKGEWLPLGALAAAPVAAPTAAAAPLVAWKQQQQQREGQEQQQQQQQQQQGEAVPFRPHHGPRAAGWQPAPAAEPGLRRRVAGSSSSGGAQQRGSGSGGGGIVGSGDGAPRLHQGGHA